MPFYRKRKRGRRNSLSGRPRLQHSPSNMGATLGLNAGNEYFIAVPNQTAGSSAGTARSGADRDREVDNGSKVPFVHTEISVSGATSEGILEVAVVKYQRQTVLPNWGVDPVPADADVATVGLQQQARLLTPGWVIKYIQIPYTTETISMRTLKINLQKFRMAGWRDGDYLAVLVYNRSANGVTFNIQSRYYEYR